MIEIVGLKIISFLNLACRILLSFRNVIVLRLELDYLLFIKGRLDRLTVGLYPSMNMGLLSIMVKFLVLIFRIVVLT